MDNASAFGNGALVADTAKSGTAVGFLARSRGIASSALGRSADANGFGATAVGNEAITNGNLATAVGQGASSTSTRATTVGAAASASADRTTAVGADASAGFANSTAIGNNAATTADDELALGGAGSSVRIGDIDASTAAQQGPVDVVTVDGNGVLGRQSVATAASVDNIRVSMDALAQVSDAQFAALEGRVVGLETGLAQTNFRLEEIDQGLSGGIAAAAALGSAIAMPDKDFVLAGNVATYRGEQGYALTFVGRASENFALTAGVAGNSGDGDVIAQAGFAFGF
ncbi:MAG: hypothetical protein AAFQ13_01640, partial [Pseudomonadota bacterium]